MFPIKYIDNNLVWNKDNEVFAYYELIPYNYSFLSAEQKFIVHDSFRQLIAQSRDLNVKLVRPAGDMLGLHSEFLPASKRYINDYVQYVKSDFLAGLGFGATQQLGETTGIYMGYSVDTGRNVYLQPSLASQGVKGTVTNALASAFVGSLGGGKSFCNNLLVYYAVLFGGQALLLDPKSERGNWKETLPEIAHEINIVNLTSDKDNAGLLDPFVIMKNVKDAESLAIDILTFLTGISSRDGEKFPVLRKAVRSVTQSDSRGLLHVIDELRREDTPISRNIADHIDSFTDYDFAHLLFSDGTVENAISLDNQLNIIQVADLVLPDKDTTFEEYTTIELLSVSMLIVISTFALDFIHSDRSIFKIVDLDEAWAFLNVAQGETLSNKLVRAGRAMQAGVYFVTQSAYDVSKESLKNNIGLKFAFRSTDINEIKQTLEFFGIDKDDENNQKRLSAVASNYYLGLHILSGRLRGTSVSAKQEYRRVLHTNQRYRWNGKTPNRLLLPARVADVGLRHTVLVLFSVRRYQLFHSTIASIPNNQRKYSGYCHHTHTSSLDISTLHSLPFVPVLPIPAELLNTD